jgi:PAS domain S-box-containing protein
MGGAMSKPELHSLLRRQLTRCFGAAKPSGSGWEPFIAAVNEAYHESDTEQAMLEQCMDLVSQEMLQTNSEMRTVFQTLPDLLLRLDAQGIILDVNGRLAAQLNPPAGELLQKSVYQVRIRQVGEVFCQAFKQALTQNRPVEAEYCHTVSGQDYHYEARLAPVPGGQCIAIIRDITGRKRAEAELARVQAEREELSRSAGMAEVAIEVIHHIGNGLTSINVASALAIEQLRNSKASFLPKVVELLRQHSSDLPEFIAQDPKGKALPRFLENLAKHLMEERARLLLQMADLQKSVDTVKSIVVMQQEHAAWHPMPHRSLLSQMVAEALKPFADEIKRHHIAVHQAFNPRLRITVDTHVAVGILKALLSNARLACLASGGSGNAITVRVLAGEAHLHISISHTGAAIAAEDLHRVFHPDGISGEAGSGLPLHNAALNAKVLGGRLRIQNQGAELGATFVLTLPLRPGKSRPEEHSSSR